MHNHKGKKNPNYKDGRSLQINKCIDCGKQTSDYRRKRCFECSSKQHSKRMKGIKFGKEHKQKIGLKHKNKIISTDVRRKMSISHGGTGIPYSDRDYPKEFYYIKEQIRKRDKYKCKICRKKENKNFVGKKLQKLSIHHIDYNKENCSEDNLISLCRSCHSKVNYNKAQWKNYWS